jgi:hypothetical protein
VAASPKGFGFSTFVRDDGIRSVESAVLPEREGTIVETAELIANAGGAAAIREQRRSDLARQSLDLRAICVVARRLRGRPRCGRKRLVIVALRCVFGPLLGRFGPTRTRVCVVGRPSRPV